MFRRRKVFAECSCGTLVYVFVMLTAYLQRVVTVEEGWGYNFVANGWFTTYIRFILPDPILCSGMGTADLCEGSNAADGVPYAA